MTADAVGGVWTYALELARALRPRGVRVSLATMGPRPSAAQRRAAAAVDGLTLHESDFRLEWMPDAWREVDAAAVWLLDLAAALAPDVIHLNGYAHAVLPWPAPALVVGHSCVLSWYDAVHRAPTPPEWREYARRVSAGLRAAPAVVAPSRAMANALRREYAVTRPIDVIPNGRDAGRFAAASRKHRFAFASGRLWDPAKNIVALDAAAAALPWPVYVAGDTGGAHGAKVAFSRLRCLGVLAERSLRGWYARAAVYAAPARYEPFGLSVLEAALSRCALVLGDIDSLRELWDGAACFVAPDDAAALATALRGLLEDGALCRRMGDRARRRARRYGAPAMAAKYADVYQRLCGVPSAAEQVLSCAW
ncbi:MAG: glycosyltransferase family 4 protein [Candidatus Binatia bacterium]